MQTIDRLYVFVNQNYHALQDVGHRIPPVLTAESQLRYDNVRREHVRIVSKVAANERSAMFAIPFVPKAMEYYADLRLHDRQVVEDSLVSLADAAKKIGKRFVLVPYEYFEYRLHPRWIRRLLSIHGAECILNTKRFRSGLPFQFSEDLHVYAFGEHTSRCVDLFGKAVCRALHVDDERYHVLREGGIETYELVYDYKPYSSHEDYEQRGPGWRK